MEPQSRAVTTWSKVNYWWRALPGRDGSHSARAANSVQGVCPAQEPNETVPGVET